MLIGDGVIQWIGQQSETPDLIAEEYDCQGHAVIPGLIDCHTHFIFAGTRVDEFVARSRGATYAEIMAAGGGIRNTMRATRAASHDELVDLAMPRLQRMLSRGVTTVECKTGYGLSLDDELKMLEVIRTLRTLQPVDIVATFLGAHALPPEYDGRADAYVDHVINDMLPAVEQQGVATVCDVFVERGAFSVKQARRIFEGAHKVGLRCKVHAEQLTWQGGAKLAAEIGALSASHLEYSTPDDWQNMAARDVVAELLPISEVFLGAKQRMPARAMIDAGLRVAVATDFNPGSSNCDDLWLAARLAVTCGGLTVDEALLGVTQHAAAALGLDDVGVLEVGMKADFVMLKYDNVWDAFYNWSENPVESVWIDSV